MVLSFMCKLFDAYDISELYKMKRKEYEKDRKERVTRILEENQHTARIC